MTNSAKSKLSEVLDDTSMTSVPKNLFFEGMQLPVSIFFRIHSSNYLTIGRKGERATFSEFASYNDPNFLIFVRQADRAMLIDYVTELSGKLISRKNLPMSVKTKLLASTVEDCIDTLGDKGFTSVANLQKVSLLLMELNESTGSFEGVLQMLAELPVTDSRHPMAVCMISLILAEELQMNHRAALEKLALGALIHDVGLKFVPKEITDKPRHLWTPDELSVYEQHPLRGVEMLRDMKDISNDVLLIVAEHHETSQGTGFPKKLRDVKISPFGKIVGLADCFSELLFSQNPEGKVYSVDEAIAYIDDILGQPYNRQVFSALKNTINKRHLSDQKVRNG